MRRMMVGLAAVALAFVSGGVSAEGDVPDGAFVRSPSGHVYYTKGTTIIPVAVYPIADEQFAAYTMAPVWLIMMNGEVTTGPRPDWAALALTAPPAGAPSIAAVASEPSVTLSGTGALNTRPFALAGGNYTARWSAKPNTSSCFMGARLKSASSAGLGQSVVGQALYNGAAQSGETQLYRVAAGGDYYLDVDGACIWEISIAPQ